MIRTSRLWGAVTTSVAVLLALTGTAQAQQGSAVITGPSVSKVWNVALTGCVITRIDDDDQRSRWAAQRIAAAIVDGLLRIKAIFGTDLAANVSPRHSTPSRASRACSSISSPPSRTLPACR